MIIILSHLKEFRENQTTTIHHMVPKFTTKNLCNLTKVLIRDVLFSLIPKVIEKKALLNQQAEKT